MANPSLWGAYSKPTGWHSFQADRWNDLQMLQYCCGVHPLLSFVPAWQPEPEALPCFSSEAQRKRDTCWNGRMFPESFSIIPVGWKHISTGRAYERKMQGGICTWVQGQKEAQEINFLGSYIFWTYPGFLPMQDAALCGGYYWHAAIYTGLKNEYAPFLNKMSNLGRNWPAAIAIWHVDPLTMKV